MIPLFVFGLLETQSIFNIGLRGIRLIRLFRLINLFSRTSYILGQTNNRIIFTVVFSLMAVSIGAISMYMVEGNVEGTKFNNIGDAFWWAIVTVTTVGYGDVYPITTEGKVIAALLMIVGIAILGVLISTLGAGLVESRLKPKPKPGEDTKNKIKEGIDILELLQKDDVNSLINMITSLHTELNKPQSQSQLSCMSCGHINPKLSHFCNQCGYSIISKYGDTPLFFRHIASIFLTTIADTSCSILNLPILIKARSPPLFSSNGAPYDDSISIELPSFFKSVVFLSEIGQVQLKNEC